MTVVVVATYLPDEEHFRSDRYPVDAVLCPPGGDHHYYKGLAAHWESDATIVNVERDVEATDAHIEALLACPKPLCGFVYECHWASTGAGSLIAAGMGDWHTHLQGGEEWADWSAIGLVKITPAARIAPLSCEPWYAVEKAIHRAVARPWHLHGNDADGSHRVSHHHW